MSTHQGPKLTQKWAPFGTSVFTRMSQLATQHNAINLAQGFPDFDGPESVKEAAIQAIRDGRNQYAPSAGLLELRQAIADRRQTTTGMRYDPVHEVTIFSGATEAIFCALQAFLDPGAEVLALAPYYDSYPAAAMAAGLKFRGIPLTPGSFALDVDALNQSISDTTRALIINSPHNPSGHVLSMTECQALCDFAIKHDLLVITDEVYEELVFSPAEHRSLASFQDMRDRTVVISSTSKTFSLTGWKVGYTFAPENLTARLRSVHQFTVFCSATPLQWGLLAAFRLPENYYRDFRSGYQARRDFLVSMLNEAGFRCKPPAGTYFVLADYSQIRDEDDETFCRFMAEKVGVSCLPISGFYDDPQTVRATNRFVRFGFCKEEKTLKAAKAQLLGSVTLANSRK